MTLSPAELRIIHRMGLPLSRQEVARLAEWAESGEYWDAVTRAIRVARWWREGAIRRMNRKRRRK